MWTQEWLFFFFSLLILAELTLTNTQTSIGLLPYPVTVYSQLGSVHLYILFIQKMKHADFLGQYYIDLFSNSNVIIKKNLSCQKVSGLHYLTWRHGGTIFGYGVKFPWRDANGLTWFNQNQYRPFTRPPAAIDDVWLFIPADRLH